MKLLRETLETALVGRCRDQRSNVAYLADTKAAFCSDTNSVFFRTPDHLCDGERPHLGVIPRETDDLLAFVAVSFMRDTKLARYPTNRADRNVVALRDVRALLGRGIGSGDFDVLLVRKLALLAHVRPRELERPTQTDINAGRLERCACPGAALEEEKSEHWRSRVAAREARGGHARTMGARQGS